MELVQKNITSNKPTVMCFRMLNTNHCLPKAREEEEEEQLADQRND